MTLEQSIVIAASPGALFALTQDSGCRLEWDPFMKSAHLLGGMREPAVGVRAYCVSHSGLGMETEYVSFNPPRTCAVRMTRGPRWIGTFAGSWRFAEVSPGRTRVSFRYHVRARPWWLSWLLTALMGWFFAQATRKRLVALKAAGEQRGALARKRGWCGIRRCRRPPTRQAVNAWVGGPSNSDRAGSLVIGMPGVLIERELFSPAL
jgi:hypothetical protein